MRPDVSVSWAASERGDGLGYDVESFRPDGSGHVIKVKTTNLGERTPFYITRWEIDVSRERADRHSLYRVHNFARDPRIYVVDGSIEARAAGAKGVPGSAPCVLGHGWAMGPGHNMKLVWRGTWWEADQWHQPMNSI